MRLLRYGPQGQEKPGLLDSAGILRDLSEHMVDITGETLSEARLDRLRALDANTLPKVPGSPRIGACVAGVGTFVCIGLNYSDHAKELNLAIPTEPVVFLKSTGSICGANDPYELPDAEAKLDWEVELGIVIGKRAKNISEAEALDHVAGYCCINDGSERRRQLEMLGQWTKGKSHDSFGPIGPWLLTKDALPDTGNLPLTTRVNGKIMQQGTTATMIFSVPEIIAYLSRMMTLHPGDVIATGTPPGVGVGMKPDPVFLKIGDQLSLEIEGLGQQNHEVIAAP